MKEGIAPAQANTTCESWAGEPEQISGYYNCWHDDTAYIYPAIDLNSGYTPAADAGKNVAFYWTQLHFLVNFKSVPGYLWPCTGVTTEVVDPFNTTKIIGDFQYLHIDPYAGVVNSSTHYWDSYNQWWWRNIGDISDSQPAGCLTTAPHLHQAGNDDWWTAIQPNQDGPSSELSQQSGWVHKVEFVR